MKFWKKRFEKDYLLIFFFFFFFKKKRFLVRKQKNKNKKNNFILRFKSNLIKDRVLYYENDFLGFLL